MPDMNQVPFMVGDFAEYGVLGPVRFPFQLQRRYPPSGPSLPSRSYSANPFTQPMIWAAQWNYSVGGAFCNMPVAFSFQSSPHPLQRYFVSSMASCSAVASICFRLRNV
jgi:hypothetical protein